MAKSSFVERNKAVREAWNKEFELVQEGKGTREWTPEQQKDILEKGRAYDENGKAHIDYINGKREFLRRLKNKFPNLFIECCAAGGYSVSLSEMEYADSFWMSDSPSVTEQVRIYKDTIKRIPANVLEKQLAITSLQNSLPHQKNKNSKIISSKDGEWNNAEICDISYYLINEITISAIFSG